MVKKIYRVYIRFLYENILQGIKCAAININFSHIDLCLDLGAGQEDWQLSMQLILPFHGTNIVQGKDRA